MSETSRHLHLTSLILEFARARFPNEEVVVFHDLPGSANKPPRIAGFVPDVFVEDVPRTIVLLGEAKTSSDLITDHSQAQIAGFVSYLAAQPRSIFVLAVPWSSSAFARQMVEGYLRQFNATCMEAFVLDGVQSRAATCSSK